MGHFLLLLWWWPSLDFHWSVLYPCISLHICIERIFEPLFTKYVRVNSQILSKIYWTTKKKTNLLSLATCNLRNYSGEKIFLWILRFVGVWNICKNPRKFRNRVCLIFFLHKIMRININVTFDTTFFLFYVLTFVYITSLHLVEFAYHTKDLWLEIDSISWQHPPFLDVLLNASQNFLV